MRLPTQPTIVFAGAQDRNLELLEAAGVEAVMASYAHIGKKSAQYMRDLESKPLAYLDSGVFTFMRRAGVSYQSKQGNSPEAASWEEFLTFAKKFVKYIRENMDAWDWIVELDVDELFGVEHADLLREKLVETVGDKLLPVWHAQRGPEGWSQMVRDFPYICLSPTKTFNRGRGMDRVVESMLAEAHANGCLVHILGVENITWFDLGADTIDASSWTSGARWGQFKMPGAITNIILPTAEKQSIRRPVVHSHIAQLKDLVEKWGYTLDDLKKEKVAKAVCIRLLLERQTNARGRRIAQAAERLSRDSEAGPSSEAIDPHAFGRQAPSVVSGLVRSGGSLSSDGASGA